jgi:transglutaminase-like putative cysteine protease
MLLTINHSTHYRYDDPVPYGLMQIRLTPRSGVVQKVHRWNLSIAGGRRQVGFLDHHRNLVELIAVDPDASEVVVEGAGLVETLSDNSILSRHDGIAPLWLYRRATALTGSGPAIEALAGSIQGEPDIAALHEISHRILSAVVYETGRTHSGSTAEDAVAEGAGVCQDHAHIFLAVCRRLGVPARYVSGYLLVDELEQQNASHAWAEAWVDQLGWVGFDVSNGISPDQRYVRVATGLDYDDVAPIAGMRHGSSEETMDVAVQVQRQMESQQ